MDDHFLNLTFAHRDHAAPPHLHLVEQRGRNERCPAGDQYPVERGLTGCTCESISVEQAGLHPQALQTLLGLQVQRAVPFNGEDLGAQFGQHGGLVAAAGSDLQHLHPPGHLQQLGLVGHGPGLGDGLPARNGEGVVLVGHLNEGRIVDEKMTWNRSDGLKHPIIGDTAGSQVLHQLAAQALVPVGIRCTAHGPVKVTCPPTSFADPFTFAAPHIDRPQRTMPRPSSPVRIGVIGAGHLGRIHIQQWGEVRGAQLVGFHDADPARSAIIAAEFGVTSFPTEDELIASVDAVDVVTPTITHHLLATKVLEQGRHLFIEKPLAQTMDEADRLVALAERTGLCVQVGHVERFNPAFRAALPYFNGPRFIESHRLAQFNPRGTDVSVVLDLMIHDIDLILHVVNSPVTQINASGVAVVSDTPDIANARIAFANGCVANLTASRISMKNMRKSRFFQRDAYIAVDMLERSAEIVRMRAVVGEPDPFAVTIDLGGGKGHREISFEKPEVPRTNAIRDELDAFVKSIISGTATAVTIHDGRLAMDVAHRILEGLKTQEL